MGRAMNAITRTLVDFAPDPHGGWLFSSLARAANPNAAALGGSALPVTERSATWYGWTQAPQRFRGAAALGAAQVYAPRSAVINDQVTTTNSTVSDIFRQRMARGLRG